MPTVFPVPKLSDASETSLWIFKRASTAVLSTTWSYNFNLLRKYSFFFIFVEKLYNREDIETKLINREPVTNLTHWHFLLLWLYGATVSSCSEITSRNLMIRFEDFRHSSSNSQFYRKSLSHELANKPWIRDLRYSYQ